MTAAQFQALGPAAADELQRARFEALAEWGIPLEDARAIAGCVTLDIVDAIALVRRGCPTQLVVAILA
jgi:hypothetical protein